MIDEDDSVKEPFENLDLAYIHCFGWTAKKNSWLALACQAQTSGWRNIDVNQLEKDMTDDVNASYYRVVQAELKDLDTETTYVVLFNNERSLWEAEIKDSPKADLEIQERADLFKSELFKKICDRSAELLQRADKMYLEVVKQHLDEGELLDIDVVKLEAIHFWLDKKYFIDHLKDGQYL